MNQILQNVAAAVTAMVATGGGMMAIDSRYVDVGEADRLYQNKLVAEQRIVAQLAVNTSVAATLIDLRVMQYRYTADNTNSPAERDAMLEQMQVAKNELQKLGEHYERATQSPLGQSSSITGRN